MSIRYDKLIKLMQAKGVNSYVCKTRHIIGQASYRKIMNHENIDMRTLDNLCRYLNAQPGDLLEYVDDTVTNNSDTVTINRDMEGHDFISAIQARNQEIDGANNTKLIEALMERH